MYERIFVQVIAEIAAQKGIPDARLARIAWPHQKGAPTAWRKMRNDENNPKRLNIEEAYLLTKALNVSMSDVCGMVQGRLLNLKTNLNDGIDPPPMSQWTRRHQCAKSGKKTNLNHKGAGHGTSMPDRT